MRPALLDSLGLAYDVVQSISEGVEIVRLVYR